MAQLWTSKRTGRTYDTTQTDALGNWLVVDPGPGYGEDQATAELLAAALGPVLDQSKTTRALAMTMNAVIQTDLNHLDQHGQLPEMTMPPSLAPRHDTGMVRIIATSILVGMVACFIPVAVITFIVSMHHPASSGDPRAIALLGAVTFGLFAAVLPGVLVGIVLGLIRQHREQDQRNADPVRNHFARYWDVRQKARQALPQGASVPAVRNTLAGYLYN